ncbi:MAG: glycosyltransferase family 2 protein [Bacteroidales bacterium]|nr:glycosyltransferase family 2 protein [Bacteroidales bacterium]
MKKVSVILTTYNSGQFLQKTIDSILKQTAAGIDFEIDLIVVDDCSNDDTVAILKRNKLNYWVNEKNSGGPNKGRNIGLDIATGDYICITDHDDEWHPNRIMTLLPLLLKVPVVTSGYTLIDLVTSKKQERSCFDSDIKYFEENETFLSKLSKSAKGQSTYLGSIIYSNSLKSVRFEEEFGALDYDWILRLFYKQRSAEICASLYNRYVEQSNLSMDENYRKKDFEYALKVIEKYKEAYPKAVKKAYKKIHGTMGRYYYVSGKMKKARYFFVKAGFSWKNVAYFITSFYGSSYVIKKFNVFG